MKLDDDPKEIKKKNAQRLQNAQHEQNIDNCENEQGQQEPDEQNIKQQNPEQPAPEKQNPAQPNPVQQDLNEQDAEPLDAKPLDVESLDAEPLNVKTQDEELPDAEPLDAEPLDAEPLDAEPLDAEPLDAEPLDAEPLDAEPLDADDILAGYTPTQIEDTNIEDIRQMRAERQARRQQRLKMRRIRGACTLLLLALVIASGVGLATRGIRIKKAKPETLVPAAETTASTAETLVPESTAPETTAAPESVAASAHTTYAQDKQPAIALTFDDGPSTETTGKILDVLEQYGAHATFFALGQNAEAGADLLKREVALGCEIGTHTWDHKKLRNISYAERQKEYDKSISALEKYSGAKVTLIRPPYGANNPEIKQELDLPWILWSLDTLDWQTKDTQNTIKVMTNEVKEGDIILMHDIQASTAEAIPTIIPMLIEKGYKLLTVTELYDYYGEELTLHRNHTYSGPQEDVSSESTESPQSTDAESSAAAETESMNTESSAETAEGSSEE